eukprot:TCALIF_09790-PA protein Name:"Protein of unknown function" AED:0.23 eAED:0.23 QI:0/0.33/0/0.57/1/1/7/0/422
MDFIGNPRVPISRESLETDQCPVRSNQGTRTPFWWAGVTYHNSPNASLEGDSTLSPNSWGGKSITNGLETIDVLSLTSAGPAQQFIDPDSVRPRRYLLNTMNERPPDPKCVFSRANSSELEFDYGAAISVQCEALSFQGENDSIFDVTGISLNSKLKGDLLQQTLVKNMKTQNKKPVKKCFKKSSSMDEMTVPDGLQLLKEHLGTNQEYYENLRRCYELEETGPQRRFSLAKQLAEQVQSKPQNVPEAQGNHPSRLRRAFSEQNLPEEHSLANDNSDDSDEALMDLHTISSFPVRGPKSLRKMKKILKKVLAFEAVLTQLRGKLLSEKVLNPMEDKVDLVQETVMEANTSWSQKGPLKDASIQNVDETTNQTTKISEVPISTETLKNPTSPKQKRPAFNQFLPRIVRNFSPVSRCFHPSLFQ